MNDFEEEIEIIGEVKLHMSLHVKIISNNEDSTELSSVKQTSYQYGVGSLIYLLNHIRNDISNPVRELTKTMDCDSEKYYTFIPKLIKYLQNTKDFRVKFTDIKYTKWSLNCYSDSYWEGYQDNWIFLL